MKPVVALDCRLSDWPGIGRYLRELTEVLAAQAGDMGFLWVCRPGDEARWPTGPDLRVSAAPWPAFSLREQLGWRAWMTAQDLALWHAPIAHHLPWTGAVPLVVTMHDLILHHLPRLAPSLAGLAYYRVANAVAIRRASRIICISDATRQDVAKVWPASVPRLHTVLHGVAQRFRQPGQVPAALLPSALPDALRRRGGYLLYVGTCKPHKNLDRLLQAYARLPAALRDAHPLVLLVKLRDRNPQADRVAASLGLGPWLHWLQDVSESELAALYAHARAVLLVSLMEGWGAPVSEAMGSGTPSLVTRGSAQAEVAGPAGLACDALDLADMAAALQRLLQDDALHQRLSAAARTRAKQFDWHQTALQTAQVYRQALGLAGDQAACASSPGSVALPSDSNCSK